MDSGSIDWEDRKGYLVTICQVRRIIERGFIMLSCGVVKRFFKRAIYGPPTHPFLFAVNIRSGFGLFHVGFVSRCYGTT